MYRRCWRESFFRINRKLGKQTLAHNFNGAFINCKTPDFKFVGSFCACTHSYGCHTIAKKIQTKNEWLKCGVPQVSSKQEKEATPSLKEAGTEVDWQLIGPIIAGEQAGLINPPDLLIFSSSSNGELARAGRSYLTVTY